MQSILITGGAGFIGSNFIIHILQNRDDLKIINLDSLTYAGNLQNLKSVESHPNYTFIKGDICDKELVERILREYKISSIIHFAAESHVDNSITSPQNFVRTNINGTFNLLDCAFRFWFESPFTPKNAYNNTLFYHISTDEVFGSLGKSDYFSETTPYAPNSPYSASKASSDMLVRSYAHTYGLNAVISNCSNNYGKHQHDEKLIPTIIRNALNGSEIPIYGDGRNIRDWLFVEDHCRAIEMIFNHAKNCITKNIAKNANGGGSHDVPNSHSQDSKHNTESKVYFDTFNIGGNEEWENLNIANTICTHLDKILPKGESYTKQIRFVKDRAGHDRRYAIDSSKIQNTLGWKPKESFVSGIGKTIKWFVEKYKLCYNSKIDTLMSK